MGWRVGVVCAAVWGLLGPPALAEMHGGAGLPPGYLHTQGSQIVDEHGVPVRIAAIGWNGGDGQARVPEGLYTVNYRQTLDAMLALGFNAIRLPYCDQWVGAHSSAVPFNNSSYTAIDYRLNPDLRDLTALEVMDRIIAHAGSIGLKVVIDHHNSNCQGGQQTNGLWYDQNTPVAVFESNWLDLVHRYKGNDTIIGYDLHNEPLETAQWGSGGLNDWRAEAEKLGRLIQEIDPGPLIIVEGPQTWHRQRNMPDAGPEGNLQGVRNLPVRLPVRNKVVYSVHEYPPSVADFRINRDPVELVTHMNRIWGYLVTEGIAPVWIGEMGSSLKTDVDRRWARVMTEYMNGNVAELGGPRFTGNQQGIGSTWWCWGHLDAWVPNGILADWNGRARPDQYAVVNQLLMRRVETRDDP